jgi:hypothetical protein
MSDKDCSRRQWLLVGAGGMAAINPWRFANGTVPNGARDSPHPRRCAAWRLPRCNGARAHRADEIPCIEHDRRDSVGRRLPCCAGGSKEQPCGRVGHDPCALRAYDPLPTHLQVAQLRSATGFRAGQHRLQFAVAAGRRAAGAVGGEDGRRLHRLVPGKSQAILLRHSRRRLADAFPRNHVCANGRIRVHPHSLSRECAGELLRLHYSMATVSPSL